MRQKQELQPAPAVEVVILAGGASSRMGRDKARARIGGRTLLSLSRAAARATGWPVRVLRRDAVPKCGPLGGVLTALRARPAGALVFLSCDMPFVTPAMVRRVAQAVATRSIAACFVDADDRAGFPFAVRREAVTVMERQIARGELSLQSFARATKARRLPIQPRVAWRWFNVNTPADLARARQLAAKFRRAGETSLVCADESGIVRA